MLTSHLTYEVFIVHCFVSSITFSTFMLNTFLLYYSFLFHLLFLFCLFLSVFVSFFLPTSLSLKFAVGGSCLPHGPTTEVCVPVCVCVSAHGPHPDSVLVCGAPLSF